MFFIVEFKEGSKNYVEVVPGSWFEDGVLQYPHKIKNPIPLIKSSRNPDSTWATYPARILHAYATYDDARKHISAAEDKSDLSSAESDEAKRGQVKRSRTDREQNKASSDSAGSDDEVNKSVLQAPPKFNNSFSQIPPPTPSTSQIVSAPESNISVEFHNTGFGELII
ncbi:hypothetical protein Fcan01_00894 [Folsomia candida]|uniref:Uncharacterized protein n=1 Tax=Folsomia candida TaxID=158441 RepID=A0A226F610_FOLCA|nr:hypothetical protein Fcan01_00894 [Folsomia candida]